MRLTRSLLVIGTVVSFPFAFARPTLAQDNTPAPATFASRITVSAALGYAYPIGSTETGNDTHAGRSTRRPRLKSDLQYRNHQFHQSFAFRQNQVTKCRRVAGLLHRKRSTGRRLLSS